MAATVSFTTSNPVVYGRSGYNKYVSDRQLGCFVSFPSLYLSLRTHIHTPELEANPLLFSRDDKDDDDQENKFRNYGRSGYNK